nr:hypothetical protein BGP89_11350 [Luteimonas sp. JM171]
MLTMNVDARQLERAPRVVARAWVVAGNRAVRRTTQWARTHGSRAIAQAEQIPVGRIRKRMRGQVQKQPNGSLVGKAWFGLKPMPASYAGKPRQLRRGGTRAGKHSWEGGFVATMPNGHTGIFERMGRSRLPIVETMLHLEKAPDALRPVERQIPEQLSKALEQELKYEMLKQQGGA